MYKVTSRWPHQNSVKVEWNLGKRCNYDCSYCPSVIHDLTSPHTDIEILKSTVDKLMTIGKPIRLSFTGGEPTVHPKFSELINYCKHVGIPWISVTTNGTRKKEWYLNQRVDQWVFSLHFEYLWHLVSNTILRVHDEWKGGLLVNVMAHHEHMKWVRETVDLFKQKGVPHGVRRIRWTQGDHDLFDDMRYHLDDLEWIKQQDSTVQGNCIIDDEKIMHANDVIKLHLNQYKGWTCNAGLESLMINWDGDVHRATCRVGGSLGNIYQGTFTIPTESITCDRNYCTCAADIPLTKQKI
jgi:MoaA/NifB/PqqE/SkfB family radical SAM enzyme